ncbi:MAG: metal-dependent transcriptional regulator [Planctomycetota bacterium]
MPSGDRVSLGQVAQSVGVKPGTTTTMIKKLAKEDYINYLPRKGVRLKDAGVDVAVQVLRQQHLFKLLLVEVLKMDGVDINGEAEAIGYVDSENVFEKMTQILGQPDIEPIRLPEML